MLHVPGLYIIETEERGRGVYTSEELIKGDLIEICPMIILPKKDELLVHHTLLHDYYFVSPKPASKMCIVLGYGSIYNHSSIPNAEIVFDVPEKNLHIQATKDIAIGEEIVIDYQGGIEDAPNLWFKEKD